MFEVGDGRETTLQKSIVHRCKFIVLFGELTSTDGDEISSVKMLGNIQDHKGCFRDVEWEEWLDAMGHVVGRMTGRFLSCDAISPEDMMRECWPLCDVTVARFDKRVADCAMGTFDDSVCLRVVCRDTNVTDVVCLHEPVECGYEGCSIVGNNFFESSPMAEDLFEDDGTKGMTCFCAKHTKFWPCRKRAASLNNV